MEGLKHLLVGFSWFRSEKQLKPHIVCIEKLWRDPDGEGWLHGNWFLRPNETFHLATRKFLEKVRLTLFIVRTGLVIQELKIAMSENVDTHTGCN